MVVRPPRAILREGKERRVIAEVPPRRRGERDRLRRGDGKLLGRDHAQLAHLRQDDVAAGVGGGLVAVGAVAGGRLRQPGQQRRFAQRQVGGALAEVGPRGRLNAAEVASVRGEVEVHLQDLVLGPQPLQLQRAEGFDGLGPERPRAVVHHGGRAAW